MKDAALEAKVLSYIQKFGTGSGWHYKCAN